MDIMLLETYDKYAAYNIINRIVPITTIKRDDDRCISCKKCDTFCPMDIKISKHKMIAGKDCLRCYACVAPGNCPAKVNAMELSFFGRTVNPLIFGISAMIFYYTLTCILIIL